MEQTLFMDFRMRCLYATEKLDRRRSIHVEGIETTSDEKMDFTVNNHGQKI